jgi:hypothetical protein
MIATALRTCFLALLTLAVLTSVARADPAPAGAPQASSDAVDLARMDAELQYFAREARLERTFAGSVSLGFAAALVPTGVVVATRGDNESHLVAGGLIAGGATPLLPAFFTLFPSKVEGLEKDFQARQAAGRPASETLAAMERAWFIAAERNRANRIHVGIAGLALGGAALGTSLVFLLAKPGLGGISETGQYAVGSALLGAGVSITTLSLRSLLLPSVEETSWEAYQRAKVGSPPRAAWVLPSVSVAPTRGGGVAVLGASF